MIMIVDSPILFNPTLEKNATHLTLLWSPPFLWPGERIQYYSISFTNKSDSSITYYRVNSSYSNQVVQFTRQIQMLMCIGAEFMFGISAISTSKSLQVFNVTGQILPSCELKVHGICTC